MKEPVNDSGKRIGKILHVFYLLLILATIICIGRLIYIQLFYIPHNRDIKYFTTHSKKEIINPIRGSIYDCNNKLLVMSTPMYQIYMDCTVQKEAFKNKPEKEKNGYHQQIVYQEDYQVFTKTKLPYSITI